MTTISKDDAKALFDELRNLGIRGDELLREILDTQAWIPLGYATFYEAWPHLMGDYYSGSSMMRTALSIHFASEINPTTLRRIDAPVNLSHVQHIWWTLQSGVTVEEIRKASWGRSWRGISGVLDGTLARLLGEHPAKDPRGVARHERALQEQREKFFGGDPDGIWIKTENREIFEKERPKYRRKAHDASYPDRPYRISIDFTNEEIERFKRIAEAKGSDIKTEARKAIVRRFDALEADLSLSV